MDNLLVDEPVNTQLVNREIKFFIKIIYIYKHIYLHKMRTVNMPDTN